MPYSHHRAFAPFGTEIAASHMLCQMPILNYYLPTYYVALQGQRRTRGLFGYAPQQACQGLLRPACGLYGRIPAFPLLATAAFRRASSRADPGSDLQVSVALTDVSVRGDGPAAACRLDDGLGDAQVL